MAGKVDNNSSSWWNCFCCCKQQQNTAPTERDALARPINDGTEPGDGTRRRGSPQPSYGSYQTQQEVEGSPLR